MMFMVFHLWVQVCDPELAVYRIIYDTPRIAASFEETVKGKRITCEELRRAAGHSAGGDITVERNAARSQGIQVVQTR
jgi:hypothetical protein